MKAIRQGVKALGKHPEMGWRLEQMSLAFREWVIKFDHGTYIAQYHDDGKEIVILAVGHRRETGY